MAIKNISVKEVDKRNQCPKCREKLLYIEGTFIRWATCKNCGYKKLMEKDPKKPIPIESLK